MREKDVEQHLIDQAERQGGTAIKLTSPGRAGLPDRIVMLPGGRIAFVEVKRPGQRARPLQEHWLRVFQRYGFLARTVSTPSEAEELIRDLQTP